MNPDNPTPREQLEARVTALLLGELPPDEAAALRELMSQDAELAALHGRLARAIELVRETAADPVEQTAEQPAPLHLSHERRDKVLAQFKTVKPREFARPQPRYREWLVPAAAAAALLLIIGVMAMPNFVRARLTSQSNAIINNLRQLDGAKQQWALESKASPDATPTMSDILPYMGRGPGEMPAPIAGEKYVIGKVNESPAIELDAKQARKWSYGGIALQKNPDASGHQRFDLDELYGFVAGEKGDTRSAAVAAAGAAWDPTTKKNQEYAAAHSGGGVSNVFSVNVVGYVNIPVQSNKFYLMENPLDDGKGNIVTNVMPLNGSLARSDAAMPQAATIPPGAAIAGAATPPPSFRNNIVLPSTTEVAAADTGYDTFMLDTSSTGQTRDDVGGKRNSWVSGGAAVAGQASAAEAGNFYLSLNATNGLVGSSGAITNLDSMNFVNNGVLVTDGRGDVNKQGNNPNFAWNLGEPARPGGTVTASFNTADTFSTSGVLGTGWDGVHLGENTGLYQIDGILTNLNVSAGTGPIKNGDLAMNAETFRDGASVANDNRVGSLGWGGGRGGGGGGFGGGGGGGFGGGGGAMGGTWPAQPNPIYVGGSASTSATAGETVIDPATGLPAAQRIFALDGLLSNQSASQPVVYDGRTGTLTARNADAAETLVEARTLNPADGRIKARFAEVTPTPAKGVDWSGTINGISQTTTTTTGSASAVGNNFGLAQQGAVGGTIGGNTLPSATLADVPLAGQLFRSEKPASALSPKQVAAETPKTPYKAANYNGTYPNQTSAGNNDASQASQRAVGFQWYTGGSNITDETLASGQPNQPWEVRAQLSRPPAKGAEWLMTPNSPVMSPQPAQMAVRDAVRREASTVHSADAPRSLGFTFTNGTVQPADRGESAMRVDEIPVKTAMTSDISRSLDLLSRGYKVQSFNNDGELATENNPSLLARAQTVMTNGWTTPAPQPAGGVGTVSSTRDYPNSTMNGPVSVSVDPETGGLIVITDDKTFQSVTNVIRGVDLPLELDRLTRRVDKFGVAEPLAAKAYNIPLKYANPADVNTALKQLGPVNVTTDPRTASLIVVADDKTYRSVKDLVARLDVPTKEVLIESKLVSTNADDRPAPRVAAPPLIPQPEVLVRENAFSTFSLNVSDVSFKLSGASLEKGLMPDPGTVRSEEFINAFDYRDPEPPPGARIGFAWERARDPFAHNRDWLRFAVKTAAAGRPPGRPMNIVLLLDNSGSMERADRVAIIREALRVLAAQLQPQDRLSVVTFARTARLWVDGISGSEAAAALEKAGELTPEGGTNLEEAMRLAYETALRHYLAGGLNRVVLLTDGAANLGNVDPAMLKQEVELHRKQGVALDCFGIGWEGYNDDLLEVLSRNGDGRYGFINTPEEAATGFAGQLAGAFNVAASDVKVQVEFNPKRATAYRQIGYARHQLTKEQFRDNTVNAAQIAAAESGNALYTVDVNPQGEGPVCTVRVRYRLPGTQDYREQAWDVPYNGAAPALEQSGPAMRLAGTSAAFAEWLGNSPFATEVTTDRLLACLNGVPEVYGADERPKKLEAMIRQAKSLTGK